LGSIGYMNAQSSDDTTSSSSESSSDSTETKTYGLKYNNITKKNEIWQLNEDGSEELLKSFEFPSGNNAWDAEKSYVDEKTGKLYLWDSGGSECAGQPGFIKVDGGCRLFGDDEKGFVTYDPKTNAIETGIKKGYKTGYQKTFTSVFALDDLISEQENGEIHIGENSLVTVEKDGMQLLYATNANGDQIDINIKKGTDLLVDGKSVTQALKDIDTNKTNIAKNADDIDTNKTNIAKNADDIDTNKTNIAKNADNIAANKTNIATNTTNIATNKTNIETNALGIANNSVQIDNLAALVNSNVNRIEGLETLTGLMRNEYRTGIASSIALSQIQYASDGLSIGVGHGKFKDKDEMAVGIGYGGQFNEKVGYQIKFGSSGDSTGFGFTMRF
jgi:hypothetical protein